ncbi:MAG: c-type cytochrome [Pseudohongiellaceae bacterium]
MKAEQTILTGQQEYNAQCADCHGTDGQGGLVSVALTLESILLSVSDPSV